MRAVGTLFDGAALGHPEVRFTTVEPAPDAVESALDDGAPAALHIRVVPNDGSLPEATKGTLKTPPARRLILADVASRVHHLLSEGRLRRGTDDELERAVLPGDIAVLVPSQRLAGMVTAELRRWRIPAVRSRTGSVFDSDAAEQWRALLAAVAAPNDPRLVRAAALGWFGGHLPAEVLVDRTLAEATERCAELAAVMRGRGVADFWEAFRGDAIARLVGGADGDRNIADADQIAELLVAATHGDVSDPHRVRELLDELVGDPEPGEAAMRRVESDADAVTVTTVHSAKGLEYPIVLVPFAFAVPRRERPYTFTRGTRRVVDVASWVPWIGPEGAAGATTEERKELSHREVDGDQLRLLYVAVTRARHRVELWWANVTSAPRSAFGRILADREAGGPVRNQLGDGATAAMVRRSIDAVAAASGGAIAVHEVPLVIEPRPLAPVPTVTGALAVPALGARTALGDPAWRAWSFTAIARRVAEGRFEPLVGGPDPDAVMWPADDDPDEGGADEPAADITPTGDDAAPASMPLADVAGGTTFGTMVHRVLEVVDFTDPLLGDALAAEVDAAARRAGLVVDPGPIAAGLAAAVATPLGSLFDGHALGDLAATDRLTELTFDLALGDDPAPPIDAADIGRLMAATLPPGDPLAPYAPTLADELDGVTLRGWLTGSIDAVFRLPCADGHRYVLVDYKSNRLHRPDDAVPLDAYRGARLVEAMVHSHYPLQALLYAVALHRFLAVRLGAAYRPEAHLGGVAYLFLRGMVGDATAGVFSWQPPVALVTGLDRLFAGDDRVMLTMKLLVPDSWAALEPWIDVGVLGAFEVHAADAIVRLGTPAGEPPPSPAVVLGAALALWAPLRGHACIDLADAPAIVAASAARPTTPRSTPMPRPRPTWARWPGPSRLAGSTPSRRARWSAWSTVTTRCRRRGRGRSCSTARGCTPSGSGSTSARSRRR